MTFDAKTFISIFIRGAKPQNIVHCLLRCTQITLQRDLLAVFHFLERVEITLLLNYCILFY